MYFFLKENFFKLINFNLKFLSKFLSFSFLKNNCTVISINYLNEKNLSVEFLVKFINIKLQQKFYLKNIIYPICNLLINKHLFAVKKVKKGMDILSEKSKKIFKNINILLKLFFNKKKLQ
jgi:hypothetical protein